MKSFSERAKSHLGEYRRKNLRVYERGSPRGGSKQYAHILPEQVGFLNILEGFRAGFLYWLPGTKLSFDQGFHHLNSSQAACFNLFWPLMYTAPQNILPEALGIGPDRAMSCAFEKILDNNEETQFDFYLELESGATTYLEFKYSETKFGSAKNDDRHQCKLREIYTPALLNKISPKYLCEELFFKNYQILRNLVYFDPKKGDHVIFMYPKENRQLNYVHKILDEAVLDTEIRTMIRVCSIEDVVSNAKTAMPEGNYPLHAHLDSYLEKYINFDANNI